MYTCPMHPEIVSDKPGICPKCGMSLVLKQNVKPISKHEDRGLGKITWKSYVPLLVIIGLIILSALVSSLTKSGVVFEFKSFILYIMTGFFIVFGGFKLMDLKGFADGYSTYDLLAQKWKSYGYIYPFIELAFGFLMLADFNPAWLLWIEFIVMAFSGIGVAIKLAKKEQFMCACLGTFLKVPLTKITLIEDFGMAILALLFIFVR